MAQTRLTERKLGRDQKRESSKGHRAWGMRGAIDVGGKTDSAGARRKAHNPVARLPIGPAAETGNDRAKPGVGPGLSERSGGPTAQRGHLKNSDYLGSVCAVLQKRVWRRGRTHYTKKMGLL